jgi:hypothetical protein
LAGTLAGAAAAAAGQIRTQQKWRADKIQQKKGQFVFHGFSCSRLMAAWAGIRRRVSQALGNAEGYAEARGKDSVFFMVSPAVG